MKFTYMPILDDMIALYQRPRTIEGRFDIYLKMIRGEKKGDMELPLAFFNPMAKEHVLEILLKLKEIDFEKLITDLCSSFSTDGPEIKIYFNLADDVGGAWTTRESTHEMSINIGPFVKRGLGVIVFYASEIITPTLVEERVKFYLDLYNTSTTC